MARRIKEEPEVHRRRIADAAGTLFESKGIVLTTMDDIAKCAGYSKATLYVYFGNKEEIVGYLVLDSMKTLKQYLENAFATGNDYKEFYLSACRAMVLYEETYPLYFSMVLDHINIDFEHSHCEEAERETFRVGEEINSLMEDFFRKGIEQGVLKDNLKIDATIFYLWGMLSGCITLASKKEAYISQEMHLTKKEFLERSFEFLYEAIKK